MTVTPDTQRAAVRALLDEIERIATEIAGPNADNVDQEGAVSARSHCRAEGGGRPVGVGSQDVRRRRRSGRGCRGACLALGRRCAAAGMVFAMHQIQVACLVRHGTGAAWFEDYLRELSVSQQR